MDKFFSARVVDLWNELDDSTLSQHIVSQLLRGSFENWANMYVMVICCGFNNRLHGFRVV